ncbi:MAG: putative nucleic acid-binding Zn-ribbon protein [Cryomorphaceae bacterium]|jgi:predicted  nucleic acid-binding Zn-ribbon protein
MLPQIESLLVIQDRDHQIQTLQSELEKIPRDAAAIRGRLVEAQSALDIARESIQRNELAVKKIDLDRKTRKNTIERLTVQQFETKKNDEFAALGAEIIRYQDMVDELETQELEYMENSDDLSSAFSKANEKLTAIKAGMTDEVKALTSKKSNNSIRIAELNEERVILVENVENTTLTMYDRVFAKKGNAAVCPLHENQCGGCHMKVISDTVSKTIQEKELSQCENCGCFLYSV